ncbi:MAG TPA: hypothetical protein VJ372_08640 [Pyrinomonadaceae bacterium]|nr:hypothetical protein [Pyrinomonadaceae bacterium]
MRAITFSLFAALLCLSSTSLASAQVAPELAKKEKNGTNDASKLASDDRSNAPSKKADEPVAWIYLVDGGRLEVEELRETSEGIWYKRGNVTTLLDQKRVARVERPSQKHPAPQSSAAPDSLNWSIADATKVENFFLTNFGRSLPTTAFGQSRLHTRWGLDHRQGMDVGLHPDSPEGIALVEFLRNEKIPFLVFRNAEPGVATGPHIHIGRASHRFMPH